MPYLIPEKICRSLGFRVFGFNKFRVLELNAECAESSMFAPCFARRWSRSKSVLRCWASIYEFTKASESNRSKAAAGSMVGLGATWKSKNRWQSRGLSSAPDQYELPDWQKEEKCYDFHGENAAADEDQIYLAEQPEFVVSVEALFMARSVDLKALAQERCLEVIHSRNHLIIKYKYEGMQSETGIPTIDSWNRERFVVIFNYGTAVLFNFGTGKACMEDECLKVVKQHAKGVFQDPNRENYCVVVRPALRKWSEGASDKIMIKELDLNGMRIISAILSQSIALDHYTKLIDGMLKSFDELNHNMMVTGTFSLKRTELFKLVASVNTALAEAILKVGLLERSDVAWQNANYDSIWGFMREEFELEDRFESLEFKTGIIQHNVAFFLDILQNRKSDALEWIIIFLISGDMCLSLYHILHGAGAL